MVVVDAYQYMLKNVSSQVDLEKLVEKVNNAGFKIASRKGGRLVSGFEMAPTAPGTVYISFADDDSDYVTGGCEISKLSRYYVVVDISEK